MNTVKKSEIVVLVIAVLVFVVGVVGHLAAASYANSNAFGYIAAPTPLIVGLLAFVAYKYAQAAERKSSSDH